MRIITKFMLALSVVGSLSLASCKDYDEDNYNNAVLNNQGQCTVDEALKQQIATLERLVQELQNNKADRTEIPDFAELIKNDANVRDALSKFIKESLGDENIQNTIIEINNLLTELKNVEGSTFIDKVSTIIKGDVYIKSLENKIDSLGNYDLEAMNNRLNVLGDSIYVMNKQVQINKDSIAILKNLIENGGTADLSNYYTKSEIDEMNKNFTTLTVLKDSIDKCRTEWEKLVADQIGIVDNKINNLNQLVQALQDADKKMSARIDSLAEVTATINTRVDSVIAVVKKLEDARAKQITGIVIQQVYNPAFGSYNSILTNLQSNMLMAYYGKATRDITFPSNEDETVEPFEVRSGGTLLNGTGNAGVVYVTINPNDVDFRGFKGLELVNSQDQPCAIRLGEVMTTDQVLSLGYTRAAQNGFYAVPATITEADLNDPKLHVNIDRGAIRDALKNFLNNANTMAGLKLSLKEIAKVALETAANNRLEAQGVKCAWNDAYGEHAVYSNYNMGALVAQPFGFNSADEVFAEGGAFWRAYERALGLVTNASKKLGTSFANQIRKQLNLNNIHSDVKDLQIKVENAIIDPIDPRTEKVTVTTDVTIPAQVVNVELDVPVDIPNHEVIVPGTTYKFETTIEIDVPVDIDKTTGNLIWGKAPYKIVKDIVIDDQKITVDGYHDVIHVKKDVTVGPFSQRVTIDITQQVNDLYNSLADGVNDRFDSVNDLLESLGKAMDDVNVMLDGINNLLGKLESGSYLNTIYNYLDKFANAFAKAAPKLFKPAMLISSDKGMGFCGVPGASSVATGKVVLVPTTYSAELVAPIFKKYIRVNDNPGQMVNGQTVDITSQLKKGKNTVEYRALDYQGNEWASTYEIVLE